MLAVHSPARSRSHDLRVQLEKVASCGVLEAIQLLPTLRWAAYGSAAEEAVERLTPLAAGYREDPLGAYLAVHALAAVPSAAAGAVLSRLLQCVDPGIRHQVAWALSTRKPIPTSMEFLIEISEQGGFGQMVAELTLESWLQDSPTLIHEFAGHSRDRLRWLATKPPATLPGNRAKPGLRIAQVLMQGRIDGELTAGGSGDGGGLATLQVGLTREMARHREVAEVFLLARAIPGEGPRFDSGRERIAPNATIARLDFGPAGYVATADMWPYRPQLERQLRRFLISEGPFDALHLRFADVGTFAAARVAQDLGIPIFFTLAPDPHAVISLAESEGRLSRDNFAEADRDHHYLFRAELVNWILDNAARLALLPREGQEEQFRDLLELEVTSQPDRFRVIAEGVDAGVAVRAALEVARTATEDLTVLTDLKNSVSEMPAERHGLPMLVSVGRLNRVKGFDRLVAAWSLDPDVKARYNLLIVGGHLDEPSPEEATTLATIRRSVGADSNGLILLGNRSHNDVARILAAAVQGLDGVVGSNGIYVCASEKEEFGLAIMEALAAGLPVVAPRIGGASTYVDDGFTGYLADSSSLDDLQMAIRWADRVRLSEVRADAARRRIQKEYSLGAMADQLVSLYRAESIRESAE